MFTDSVGCIVFLLNASAGLALASSFSLINTWSKMAANGEVMSSDEEINESAELEIDTKDDVVTFKSLGVTDVLCQACEGLKWINPTKIQQESLPVALAGKDVIGLAETGSGKTGAFALPILQKLLDNPQRLFALVMTPTRELAFQISEQFEALGSTIGVKCCVIVGGIDMMTQALMLAKKPHIVIATPGRLVDHLENTKGFNLRSLKFLVMDEADRILNMDFEQEVDKILKVSCQMSDKLYHLQGQNVPCIKEKVIKCG